jgi:hypothetical protein
VHLPRLAAEALAPPCRPTFWAALGLVHQALLGEECLLAGREHEVDAALAAAKALVRKSHLVSPSSLIVHRAPGGAVLQRRYTGLRQDRGPLSDHGAEYTVKVASLQYLPPEISLNVARV